jgi:hypothetical protein
MIRTFKQKDTSILEYEFPKLMVNKITGTIVLFETEGRGVALVGHADLECLGDFSKNWNMDNFTDYHGMITIENKNI